MYNSGGRLPLKYRKQNTKMILGYNTLWRIHSNRQNLGLKFNFTLTFSTEFGVYGWFNTKSRCHQSEKSVHTVLNISFHRQDMEKVQYCHEPHSLFNFDSLSVLKQIFTKSSPLCQATSGPHALKCAAVCTIRKFWAYPAPVLYTWQKIAYFHKLYTLPLAIYFRVSIFYVFLWSDQLNIKLIATSLIYSVEWEKRYSRRERKQRIIWNQNLNKLRMIRWSHVSQEEHKQNYTAHIILF